MTVQRGSGRVHTVQASGSAPLWGVNRKDLRRGGPQEID